MVGADNRSSRMLSRLPLRGQLLVMTGITLTIAVGLGAIAIAESALFRKTVAAADRGLDAVHQSTLADMYHDAIRSVVLSAIVAAERDPASLPDVAKELQETSQSLV